MKRQLVIDLTGDEDVVAEASRADLPGIGASSSESTIVRKKCQSQKRSRIATKFQEDVYALVRTIPQGKVTTYGAVAAALGQGCARSVGSAMRNNPYGCESMP